MKQKSLSGVLAAFAAVVLLATGVVAQETTGGLQGTIKDPTGAVVSNAHVTVTGTTLVGTKEVDTDAAGYYRFANLPPGTYALTVSAKGFKTAKREGVPLEVGHLPSIDIPLEIGSILNPSVPVILACDLNTDTS